VSPLPQPEIQMPGSVMRIASRIRRDLGFFFEKKSSGNAMRQRRVLPLLRVFCEVVWGMYSDTVLRVAMEFCAAPLRVMLDGSSEQVA